MFTTHQKRFDKRFEAFGTLSQPPKLSYDDYVRGSDFSNVQSKDLLASALECFKQGKDVIDFLLSVIVSGDCDKSTINVTEKREDNDLYIPIHRNEIMALAKVCVTNTLFLHKLASIVSGEKDSNSISNSAKLEVQAHKLYCTFNIQ